MLQPGYSKGVVLEEKLWMILLSRDSQYVQTIGDVGQYYMPYNFCLVTFLILFLSMQIFSSIEFKGLCLVHNNIQEILSKWTFILLSFPHTIDLLPSCCNLVSTSDLVFPLVW